MIRSRVLLACVVGEAAAEEAPVSGPPKACRGCPLRPGGEWEPGAKASLAEMTAPAAGMTGPSPDRPSAQSSASRRRGPQLAARKAVPRAPELANVLGGEGGLSHGYECVAVLGEGSLLLSRVRTSYVRPMEPHLLTALVAAGAALAGAVIGGVVNIVAS